MQPNLETLSDRNISHKLAELYVLFIYSQIIHIYINTIDIIHCQATHAFLIAYNNDIYNELKGVVNSFLFMMAITDYAIGRNMNKKLQVFYHNVEMFMMAIIEYAIEGNINKISQVFCFVMMFDKSDSL